MNKTNKFLFPPKDKSIRFPTIQYQQPRCVFIFHLFYPQCSSLGRAPFVSTFRSSRKRWLSATTRRAFGFFFLTRANLTYCEPWKIVLFVGLLDWESRLAGWSRVLDDEQPEIYRIRSFNRIVRNSLSSWRPRATITPSRVHSRDRGNTRPEDAGVVGKKLQRSSWCREAGSSSEKTRFCRILNDSLTHQTTPFSFARNYVNSS